MYFPFENVRPIQQELVSDVTHAIEQKRHLLAHAPTGLGKTAASLSPALTIALEKGYTVIFLTPKHTQHQIAIETLQKIKQKHGLNLQVADLIGKKWMCSHTAVETLSSKEFSEFCKDLREGERCPYFNAVWGKKSQLQADAMNLLLDLKAKSPAHSEEVVNACKDTFCAYELATLLGKDAQVIIADYYHIFQPNVRAAFLGRLKKSIENSIIIVDEAHNLPNRIREILSEKMTSFVLKRAAKEARAFHFTDLSIALNYLADSFDNLANEKLKDKKENYLKKEEFIDELEKATGYVYDDLLKELGAAAIEIRKAATKSSVGSVASFLERWLGEDFGFSRIIKKQKSKAGSDFITISYNCLSPELSAAEVFNKCVSAILMSGTLVPGELYRDLLGLDLAKTEIKSYKSPFTVANRLVLIEPSTTTKYTERNEEEFQKIAKTCVDIVKEVPNNCAIFFPSYFIMQSVMPFLENSLSKKVFMDKPDFSKEQRAKILQNFRDSAESGAVLLAVQGGSFAEGIDLPGKFLQCAIVVGVPLSSPDLETKSLIDFYDYKFKRGWDYGYIFPAMTRALQAAGRCVRSVEDRGVVVFLDKRFAWANYLKCIPPEWKPIVTKLAAEKVKRFFSNQAQNAK